MSFTIQHTIIRKRNRKANVIHTSIKPIIVRHNSINFFLRQRASRHNSVFENTRQILYWRKMNKERNFPFFCQILKDFFPFSLILPVLYMFSPRYRVENNSVYFSIPISIFTKDIKLLLMHFFNENGLALRWLSKLITT